MKLRKLGLKYDSIDFFLFETFGLDFVFGEVFFSEIVLELALRALLLVEKGDFFGARHIFKTDDFFLLLCSAKEECHFLRA